MQSEHQMLQLHPSRISDLSRDQINRIILILSVMGYTPFELTDDERYLIDPINFDESIGSIIDMRGELYYGAKQKHQNSSTCSIDRCPNCEEIAKFDEKLNQVVNFFSTTTIIVEKIAMHLYNNMPQLGMSDDVEIAYKRCKMAVFNMQDVENEAVANDGYNLKGGYRGCVVTYLKELVECVVQYGIVVGSNDLKLLECLSSITGQK
ncbi:hypothetical protein H4219_006423 [Mycoemilia scoparia]|uniref:Uncharacterized protein n=1 Tax=Mycoemilia scoparia TaxID=417184 RepID=A0A9W7ZNM9_9FUNG|nr:hypothetical protein H4219_006423 [Mycoemilia scoparia]